MAPRMDYYDERVNLAAAFRWFTRLHMNEAVANHFSMVVETLPDGAPKLVLINPANRYFGSIKASDLLLLDVSSKEAVQRELETRSTYALQKAGEGFSNVDRSSLIDPTAVCIHGALHRRHPSAKCILHLHPRYTTAVACTEAIDAKSKSVCDQFLPCIDQNSCRFYNRVSIDRGFSGMGLDEEAERLAEIFNPEHRTLVLGNHGVITVGDTVGEAMDEMYYLEMSCRNYATALSTNLSLRFLQEDVATTTARQWDDGRKCYGDAFISEVKEVLNEEEPSYKM